VAEVLARVVLASGSPRRRELLERMGVAFDVVPADIDESVRPGEGPTEYVERLAREKAMAVDVGDDAVVIAADTTVDVDGRILGKPVDDDDAHAMLRALSGRAHRVHTGIAARSGDAVATDVVTTIVHIAPITPATMAWYVATGEPMDKAGAYALQGAGAVLVERVQGSVSNVIGLPLLQLDRLLGTFGLSLTALAEVQPA
jgi:septum formation protein